MDLFFKLKVTIKLPLSSFNEKLWMKSFPVLLLFLSLHTLAQDVLMQQKGARLFKTGQELMAKNQFAAARENFTEFLAVSQPGTQRQEEGKGDQQCLDHEETSIGGGNKLAHITQLGQGDDAT